VVTNARAFYTTRAAAGASSARHSPRPLTSWGEGFRHNSDASRREIADTHLKMPRRHCEEQSDEAIHSSILRRPLWIASRSLSSGAHSRDPLARNDAIKTHHTFSRHRPRNAGDPVFRSVSDEIERPRRTEYPACAGYDGSLSGKAYHAGRGRDGAAMPASRTARMPVIKMPSNVPAPPIEAMGAPRSPILSRLSRSAPISVPIEPPI
jgi:hypothetical protein